MARNRNRRRNTRRRKVPRNMVLNVTRMYTADIAKAAADTGAFSTFQALLFPTSDVFSAFSHYRIKRFKIEYQLYNQLNNNSVFPTLYIAPQQFSESAVPSALSEVIQYKGVRTFQFGPSRPVYSQTFVPYVNMVTTGPGRVPVASPWLTTTGDAVQHMANVFWLQNYNSTSAASHTIRLVVSADFELKGTR